MVQSNLMQQGAPLLLEVHPLLQCGYWGATPVSGGRIVGYPERTHFRSIARQSSQSIYLSAGYQFDEKRANREFAFANLCSDRLRRLYEAVTETPPIM